MEGGRKLCLLASMKSSMVKQLHSKDLIRVLKPILLTLANRSKPFIDLHLDLLAALETLYLLQKIDVLDACVHLLL